MHLSMPMKTKPFFYCFILLLALLICSSKTLVAQSDTIVPVDDPEKTLKNIDIRKVTSGGFNLWRDQFSGHLAGIDFGFNLFLNEDYIGYDSEFMDNDIFRSNSVYINFVQQSIGIQRYRNTIGLVTGLGLHFQTYRLDDHVTIMRDENSIIQPHEPGFENIKKSKLSIFSAMLPLLMEVQIPINNDRNRVYVSGGVYGELRLNSHTKVKYKLERNEKLKVTDHFSMYDVKYGIMVRTGYRWVNLYATYDLLPLFREGKGPELTPFSVGITLLRF